jgi:GT2 family glycosyltransferase
MNLTIVTVVKDDITALKKTRDSILRQSGAVIWKIVTPFNHTETHTLAVELFEEGVATQLLEDAGLGVYGAMNVAIYSSAPLDWIWFLNAGDELAAIDSYQNVLNRITSSTSRWAYGGHFLGSKSGETLGEVSSPAEFKASNQLFAKKYISHQATVFETSLLQQLEGFDLSFVIASDWDLMVRASKIEKPTRIKESLCVFYMGGLSTNARQKSNFELLELRKRHLPRNFFLKSIIWFLFRFFRNMLVHSFERIAPSRVNFVRKVRLKYKKSKS